MVAHSLTMLEKQLVFSGEMLPRNFPGNRVRKHTMRSEDPMSHRIIEKRRRDRMNNCLADLSRLIPPEYLKKGRGRIEKTEIIEMAIKHMGHLQNIIASTRFTENSNSLAPSLPANSAAPKNPPTVPMDQPIVIKHYRMGYLECMSEAMHFLVDIQGYFAGDSLCVQMINHLHKHCDKILTGSTLNFATKKPAVDTTGSDSSTSPVNGNHVSPILKRTKSNESTSDDNQAFDMRMGDGYCSPRRYAERCCAPKQNSENCCPKYFESDGTESENRSDGEPYQNLALKGTNDDVRKDESKFYYETAGHCQKNQKIPSSVGEPDSQEKISVKEEYGPSQLREMLTSPTSVGVSANCNSNRQPTEERGQVSPESNHSGYEIPSGNSGGSRQLSSVPATNKIFKAADAIEGHPECQDVENHHMMYKFKNNIKQRFSKEKRENLENGDSIGDQVPPKKQKCENSDRCADPLMRERINFLDFVEAEKVMIKFNADSEPHRRFRCSSESEVQDGDISNRLNFGCKANERVKKLEDAAFQHQNGQKLWSFSPNSSLPCHNSSLSHRVITGRRVADYSSTTKNSMGNPTNSPGEPGTGIPIFALHAKGSFYIPLTLDYAALAPFLTILGIAKSNEPTEHKTILHPVTISVNFQSHIIR